MYDDTLSRPMFQTPGERAGSGIMSGVAPINMQEGGWLEGSHTRHRRSWSGEA